MPNVIDVSRACLKAYVDKDRAAIEALIAPQFRFTSPIDNRLDRATYLYVPSPSLSGRLGRDTSPIDRTWRCRKLDRVRAGPSNFCEP